MSDHIWEARLDDQYDCKVTPEEATGISKGILSIHLAGVLIFSKEVDLTYDAMMEPDMDDVRHWQAVCASAVDEWEKEHAQF